MILQYVGGASVTGVFMILAIFINRHFSNKDKRKDDSDDKNKRIEELESAIKVIREDITESKLDRCRIQLLIMMNHYPNEKTEIMRLAEHYFVTLHGDWYMTGIFNNWLMDNGIGKPEWFNSEV